MVESLLSAWPQNVRHSQTGEPWNLRWATLSSMSALDGSQLNDPWTPSGLPKANLRKLGTARCESQGTALGGPVGR